MTYWSDPVPSLYPGVGASIGDEDVLGYGTRFVEPPAESARYANLEAPTLLDDAKEWAAPLLQEWDTTKAAFLDVIHEKTSASVASTEHNFRASLAGEASSPWQAYYGITSGVAGAFSSAVGSSLTGMATLLTDPIDTLQGAGRTLLAGGLKYAVAETPEKLQMLAGGATQFALAAAMGGAGVIDDVGSAASVLDEAAIAAPGARDVFLGEGYYTPKPMKPDMTDGERFGEGAHGAEFFGSAYASKKPQLRRDFSNDLHVDDALTDVHGLAYLNPMMSGVRGHTITSTLENGKLSFDIYNSGIPAAAKEFGYGNEMFAAVMRSYEKSGHPITSIAGRWEPKGTIRTNFDQFFAGLQAGLPAKIAATRTFTGRQAADFGFTEAEVFGHRFDWHAEGVDVTFRQPNWGPSAEWANYANAWVRAMGQR